MTEYKTLIEEVDNARLSAVFIEDSPYYIQSLLERISEELSERGKAESEIRVKAWNAAIDAAARIVSRDCQGCGYDAIIGLKNSRDEAIA